MSKKMSKVLMLAVALVLAVAMLCMVACSGGTPLKGEEAISTLQEGFIESDAETKTITDDIKIGGIDIKISSMGGIRLNNVDINIIREVKNNELNVSAKVSNIQAELYGSIANILSGVLAGIQGAPNIDPTAIANLSKVRFEVGLSYNKTRAKLTNLTIYGLNEVKDKSGNQLSFLEDGDGNPLGAIYKPTDIKLDENVADLLAPLAEHSDDAQLDKKIKKFIDDNYLSLSLFDFGTVTVNKSGNKITSEAPANLDRVFEIAQTAVNAYADKYIDQEEQIHLTETILEPLLGTTDVKEGLSTLIDFGTVKMNMDLKFDKDADAWKINKMQISDTMRVTISATMLGKVLNDMLPALIPNFSLPGGLDGVINAVLADGLSTNINVSINSSYVY